MTLLWKVTFYCRCLGSVDAALGILTENPLAATSAEENRALSRSDDPKNAKTLPASVESCRYFVELCRIYVESQQPTTVQTENSSNSAFRYYTIMKHLLESFIPSDNYPAACPQTLPTSHWELYFFKPSSFLIVSWKYRAYINTILQKQSLTLIQLCWSYTTDEFQFLFGHQLTIENHFQSNVFSFIKACLFLISNPLD